MVGVSQNKKIESSVMDWLTGVGPMAEAIRAFDWSQTSLGRGDQWPAALRFSVNAMLSTDHPTAIAWGEQLILLHNDAFMKLMMGEHPSPIGKPIREVWPKAWPDSWPIIEREFDRVMSRHETVFLSDQKFRLRFQNIPDTDVYLSVYEYPIYIENGQVGGVHFTLIDSSGSRKKEQSFRDYEQQFRLMIEAVSDYAIFTLTPNGEVASWNTGAEKILGYQADEIIGQHYSLFFPVEEKRASILQNEPELPKSKGRFEIEGWRVRKDGSQFLANITTTAFWADTGALLGYVKVIRDITERKQAEDALRERERIYRAIGESIDYGIWICDPDGHNIYASESFLKLVGLTQEECSKFGWGKVLHSDDAERTISAWKKCAVTGEKWDIEHRFRGVDGQWHPILARGIPVRNEQGKITAWAGINLDISAIKRVEIKLKESEEKFRTMFDAIPQLAFMAHPDGFIFQYNKRWYEYTGTTEEQMKGWGWQSVHDPEILPKVLERWKRALAIGQTFDMEFPLRGADGKFRWFLTRILPLKDSQGQVVRWFGTNTDISERKQMEEELQQTSERLSLATQAAKVGIWDWDLRTNHLLWNDQMYKLYDIPTNQFTAVYEAWENSVHPEDLPRAKKELQKALRGESEFNSEFRVVWPDGSIHNIQAIGLLKKDSSGRPVRMTGTNWEITQRKNLENDLRSAIEIRDEFLSIASHEFKTPLTALSMQIEMLNKLASTEREDVKNQIVLMSKKAITSLRSLAMLINDLLDVTKIRVGKIYLKKQEMDLKTAILKVISNAEEETKRKGIQVSFKADQPALGKWDPNRIDQIFTNLLSNAIKYGEGKPIEVTLKVDSRSNLARILIKDYGMGITKNMQSKIFERFQRAISGNSISGLGLGLYIVNQIIEAHGGSIRVESEPKKGALFIVELPLNG